jgi:hypothetical protein
MATKTHFHIGRSTPRHRKIRHASTAQATYPPFRVGDVATRALATGAVSRDIHRPDWRARHGTWRECGCHHWARYRCRACRQRFAFFGFLVWHHVDNRIDWADDSERPLTIPVDVDSAPGRSEYPYQWPAHEYRGKHHSDDSHEHLAIGPGDRFRKLRQTEYINLRPRPVHVDSWRSNRPSRTSGKTVASKGRGARQFEAARTDDHH